MLLTGVWRRGMWPGSETAGGRRRSPVHINPGIRRGVVHVLEGRCVPDDPWINLVTDDGVTDMGFGATFYECRVEVEAS